VLAGVERATFQLEVEGLRVSQGEDEDIFVVALAVCGIMCRYREDRILTRRVNHDCSRKRLK
jgi:hypothetical protein